MINQFRTFWTKLSGFTIEMIETGRELRDQRDINRMSGTLNWKGQRARRR